MRNNLGLLLQKRAHINPDMEAIIDIDKDLRLTYRELDKRVNQAANLFSSMGIEKGDRVGVLLMNGVEFIEATFGLAKIGAVTVPLNWRLTADELEFILNNSGSKILLFDSEFCNLAADLNKREGKTEINAWLQVAPPGNHENFAKNYEENKSASSVDVPNIEAEDDDILFIMYTSGTTGLPKGVVHTHNTCMWASITSSRTADVRRKDRYLLSLPMFHIGALNPVTSAVQTGTTVYILRKFDPLHVWQIIEKEHITTMLLVPAMLNFMLEVPDKEKFKHPDLRYCMSGAAPVPVSLIRDFEKLGIEIHQVYGLTETCGPACLISPDDALRKAGSTGKAFYHTDVKLITPEGNIAKPGESGEVLVRGKHIMKEYWRNPQGTAEALIDGWLHTGDIAEMDEEGFIFIKDRLKDMIISGGENIYPAEVEGAIISHSDVLDVAVIGRPSKKWGESPLAVVVRKNGALTEQEIIQFCKSKLASFKCPKEVIFHAEIPRNPSGKILKRLLREELLSEEIGA